MDIEYLHEMGYCPDRYYYQLNGRNAEENYKRIKQSRSKKNEEDAIARFYKLFIEPMIQAGLKTAVNAALDDIFKGFGK